MRGQGGRKAPTDANSMAKMTATFILEVEYRPLHQRAAVRIRPQSFVTRDPWSSTNILLYTPTTTKAPMERRPRAVPDRPNRTLAYVRL